jgi:hypothetical protein
MMNIVLPETLKKGDVIKYRTGKYVYIIYIVKQTKKFGTRIVLARIVEQDGIKKYYRVPKFDFINQIKKEGDEGGYWDREMELLESEHPLPMEEQIETISNGKRDF